MSLNAEEVQSSSIWPQSCGHCGDLTEFFVYPVYQFTFNDYLVWYSCFLLVLVYSCTWLCDDIVCLWKPTEMVKMLLLHCWYISTHGLKTKTAGLMHSMARMLGGLFEEIGDMLEKKNPIIYQRSWGIMLQTYQQFSQFSFLVILSKSRYWYLFCLFDDPFSDGGFKVIFHIAHI